MLRSFTFRERPGRNFKEITNGRMAILPDESHRAVVEDGHDHGAAIVMTTSALIRQLAFAHGRQ